MSELVIQEAVALIPGAVTELGRMPAIIHAVKVVVEAIGILFTGAKTPTPRTAISGVARLMSCSQNVEVPADSIIVIKLGNDEFPAFDQESLTFHEQALQKLVDTEGIKAKVWATNHTVDFQVLTREKVTTTVTSGDQSVTTTETKPK